MPDEELQEYNNLFFPPSSSTTATKKLPLARYVSPPRLVHRLTCGYRRIGQSFVALNVDPLAEGSIMPRTEAKDLARAASEMAEVRRITEKGDAEGMIKGILDSKGEKRVGDGVVEKVVLPSQERTRVTLDKWDYVLRQLFILKSTPLEKAIQYVSHFHMPNSEFDWSVVRNLGAGAAILLGKLTGPDVPEERRVNVKTAIKGLTIHDFERIVEEFDRWPFAPSVSSIEKLFVERLSL
jgi:hypothetical protein